MGFALRSSAAKMETRNGDCKIAIRIYRYVWTFAGQCVLFEYLRVRVCPFLYIFYRKSACLYLSTYLYLYVRIFASTHVHTSGNISIQLTLPNFLSPTTLLSDQLLSGGVAIINVEKKIFLTFPKLVCCWSPVLMREQPRQC